MTPARARVLGIAQDAGVPHPGCACTNCERRRARPLRVACLGVVAPSGATCLVDATPDLPAQAAALARLPSRILLTHAHVGHYAGLAYLGPEGLAASRVVLHVTPAMARFLSENAPWELLVRRGHVALSAHEPGSRFSLEDGLEAESFPLRHRAEYTDTVGYVLRGASRAVLWAPDADAWDADLDARLDACDVAFLDGTFFREAEVPRVTHPPVEETVARLTPARAAKVAFVHLNHTNPLLDPASAEAQDVARAGARVAREGEEHLL